MRKTEFANTPLPTSLGTPTGTEPITGSGIVNSTVGIAAERILRGVAVTRGGVRRCKLYNPTAGVMLGFTTVATDATAPTLTSSMAGTGAADGSPVPPQTTEWFTVSDASDLYLAASAAASAYQLTVLSIRA